MKRDLESFFFLLKASYKSENKRETTQVLKMAKDFNRRFIKEAAPMANKQIKNFNIINDQGNTN